MPRAHWLEELPLPARDPRALARLTRALTDYERSTAFHRGEVGWSLRRMRRLVAALGEPLRGVPVLHVAGSKGKGSVCLLAEALLRAHGLRTGLYLSPHVDRWTERIQVGGRELDAGAMGAGIEAVLRRAARAGIEMPTLFETLTAAAFVAFRRARVDVAVVEVGIGGRLDATNVVAADVSVVTALELEHTAVLGRTLRAIAGEKAGILRRGTWGLSGVPAQSPVAEVLRAAARRAGVPLLERGRGLEVRARADAFELSLARGAGAAGGAPAAIRLPAPDCGPFSVANAALATAAVLLLARRRPKLLPAFDHLRAAAALRTARLPARCETVAHDPRIVRDGAHTPRSLRAVARAIARESAPRKPVVVLALKSDKPVARCLAALRGAVGPVVATTVPGGRSRDPEEIVAAARASGIMALAEPDPARALARAVRRAGPRGVVLVTGSFWLAGLVPRLLATLRASSRSDATRDSRRPPSGRSRQPWTSRSSTISS
jgi:dihydrofolate synthase/folylpolyglutamate synthase